MIIPEEQIKQVKEWKEIKRKVRSYYCPFKLSKLGGEICKKAFKRCLHNPDKFREIFNSSFNSYCHTEPCPCKVYTFQFLMRQANMIIKYRKI